MLTKCPECSNEQVVSKSQRNKDIKCVWCGVNFHAEPYSGLSYFEKPGGFISFVGVILILPALFVLICQEWLLLCGFLLVTCLFFSLAHIANLQGRILEEMNCLNILDRKKSKAQIG